MPVRRNPVVRAGAILRKGGVHTKSVSGQRHRGKIDLRDEIDEWLDDSDDTYLIPHPCKAEGGDEPPSGSTVCVPLLLVIDTHFNYSLTASR
jgi:hypothetical protein